jgi:hypothetical protein
MNRKKDKGCGGGPDQGNPELEPEPAPKTAKSADLPCLSETEHSAHGQIDDTPREPIKWADLPGVLKAIEKEHDADDDLKDIRSRTLAAIAHSSSSDYRLGRELYGYREALPHGAWYPVLEAIYRATTKSVRTLQEVVARYRKVKDQPKELMEAMLIAGIDPAAPRRVDMLRCAVQEWLRGVPPEQAVAQAMELTKPHRALPAPKPEPPPTAAEPPLTPVEKRRWAFRVAVRTFLEEIAPNQRTEELKITLGEEIKALLGDRAQSFTVVPLESTIDRSGRRRPEPQPEPQPDPQPERVPEGVPLSEPEMAAFDQWVRRLVESELTRA